MVDGAAAAASSPSETIRSRKRRQRGIFDHHAVAGAHVLAEHALDRIEGAAGDRHRCRGNAVSFELRGGEGDQRAQFRGVAVEVRVGVKSAKRGVDGWEQGGIRVASGEVEDALRIRPIAAWEVVGRSGRAAGCRGDRAPPPDRARGARDMRQRP